MRNYLILSATTIIVFIAGNLLGGWTAYGDMQEKIETITIIETVYIPQKEYIVINQHEEIQEVEQNYIEMEAELTSYCSCPICCGVYSAEHPDNIGTDFVQYTATGTILTANRTIAVDHTIIPYGSEVEINGHIYIAEDIGGAIKGNRIDIYFNDHQEALDFGRQTQTVKIYKGE